MDRRVIEIAIFLGAVFYAFGLSTAQEVKNPGTAIVTSKKSQAYVRNEIIVKLRPGVTGDMDKRFAESVAAKEALWPSSLQRLNERYKVVKIQPLVRGFGRGKQGIKELDGKDVSRLNPRERRLVQRARRAPRGAVIPNPGNIYKIRFDLGANDSLEDIVEAYRKDTSVEYAELNHIISAVSSPNDPYYTIQWALNNEGQYYPIPGGQSASGTPDADIDAPQAWDIYTGGSDIIVAVIDSGVDYTHGDLAGNMWTDPNGHFGFDFANDDNDPMDDFGHGTHCAGIIAAETDNGQDIAGVCRDAKIMAVKFLDADGLGSESDAVSAIYYAVNNGADVISNSWGGTSYSPGLEDAINYALSEGVIIVAAAGNDNSDVPTYPASYNNVISVAATDSDDQKGIFSNYGEWVVLAAPGVDILSLRAKNTDMYLGAPGYQAGDQFVPFGDPNATMYLASGTSMAGPYVAGACAALLSTKPDLTSEEVNGILADTADPIADGICHSDGRLNLLGAVTAAIQLKSKGRIILDRDYYNCDSNVGVFLADADLTGEGTHNVSITTSGGDTETIVLTEENPPAGAFSGAIYTTTGALNVGDGMLQVMDGDIITVTYYDANDGTGNPAVVTDIGTIDCVPPVIFDVQMNILVSELTVTFSSNEPTTGTVSCGLACGGPYDLQGASAGAQTSHTITVSPLLPNTTYFFVVIAADAGGNEVIDSNSGNCYSFTTTGLGDMRVPAEFATIQQAIDQSWPGSVVWVADGNYTGPGNRDVNFQGKAITLKSENGPANCIIDCNGSAEDPHRGFYFQNGEDDNSVLDGFTITNGYAPEDVWFELDWKSAGGGICCYYASPTIKNCVITGNTARSSGGGIFGCGSNLSITGCVITANYSKYGHGGGIYMEQGEPIITECTISDNTSRSRGALYFEFYSNPKITNCIISRNVSSDGKAGIYCLDHCNLTATNCTIVDNTLAIWGGGIYCDYYSTATITNCISRDNHQTELLPNEEREIYAGEYTSVTVKYCDVQDGYSGVGNLDADPCFADPCNGNYYLQSTAGRWDPENRSWVTDDMTSPCIDAGDPNSDWTSELWPHGKRINMGAYGGTAEASMSLSTVGNIADLDNNDLVNVDDLGCFVEQWLVEAEPIKEDLDRNGFVDFGDFAVLGENWAW